VLEDLVAQHKIKLALECFHVGDNVGLHLSVVRTYGCGAELGTRNVKARIARTRGEKGATDSWVPTAANIENRLVRA
jgi:hypothetical protein